MDKELFDDLVKSMEQMNEIIAGEREPSRIFEVKPRPGHPKSYWPDPGEICSNDQYSSRYATKLGARSTRSARPSHCPVKSH